MNRLRDRTEHTLVPGQSQHLVFDHLCDVIRTGVIRNVNKQRHPKRRDTGFHNTSSFLLRLAAFAAEERSELLLVDVTSVSDVALVDVS